MRPLTSWWLQAVGWRQPGARRRRSVQRPRSELLVSYASLAFWRQHWSEAVSFLVGILTLARPITNSIKSRCHEVGHSARGSSARSPVTRWVVVTPACPYHASHWPERPTHCESLTRRPPGSAADSH